MVGRYLKLDSDLILFSIHRRLMRMIVIVCVCDFNSLICYVIYLLFNFFLFGHYLLLM